MEGYDLAREKQEAMNKVLFQKGTIGKPEWAIKRDAEQARIAEEKAAAKEKAQK